MISSVLFVLDLLRILHHVVEIAFLIIGTLLTGFDLLIYYVLE